MSRALSLMERWQKNKYLGFNWSFILCWHVTNTTKPFIMNTYIEGAIILHAHSADSIVCATYIWDVSFAVCVLSRCQTNVFSPFSVISCQHGVQPYQLQTEPGNKLCHNGSRRLHVIREKTVAPSWCTCTGYWPSTNLSWKYPWTNRALCHSLPVFLQSLGQNLSLSKSSAPK